MPSSNWFARQAHWLGAGRNPLARRGDRVEAWLVVLAVILALLVIPVAVAVGSRVQADALADAATQRATRTPATAVLLGTVPGLPAGQEEVPTSNQVDAVWKLPTGAERTGRIMADSGTPAGTRVPIWLDQSGNPTTPPLTPADASGMAFGVAVLLWTAAVVTLGLLLWLVRVALDSRRAAAWTREWARLGSDLNRY